MKNPLFSVIIPTFNRVNILSRAIDCVLNQSFEDFELIVVDNGSTDNTRKWVEENFKDNRIKYFYQQGSGSPASPRNKGLSLAKGKWICFLDSDDSWRLNKLEEISKVILSDKRFDVICHNERFYYDDKSLLGKEIRYGPFSKNMYRDMLLFGNRLSTSATSIKLEFLKKKNLKFDESENLIAVEDYDLWLNLANNNALFKFIPKTLGFYHVGNQNLISDTTKFCDNLDVLLKKHIFQTQNFDSNCSRLWKLASIRSQICKARYGHKNSLIKFISLLKIFLTSPITFSKISTKFLLRKLTLR